MPVFPGGFTALSKFIADNTHYPAEAKEKGIHGRVVVGFVVEKDGTLTHFEIVRSVNPLLDEEALRVCKMMPKWKPGKKNGEAVSVKYDIPVNFKLPENNPSKTTTPVTQTSPQEVYCTTLILVDEMPVFPGGVAALLKFITDNTHYPAEAKEKGIHGRVVVGFVVKKNGSLSHIKIARSVDPLLDKEALKVVKSMPKWKPGKQKGKAVSVKYNIPVNFKLPENNQIKMSAATADLSPQQGNFIIIDEMPSFPGGNTALMNFLCQNVHYPVDAQIKRIQGSVLVSFIVEEDGSLSNIEISKSVAPILDAEAIRVIKAMPKWNPAKQKGKPIRMKYDVPINFRLQN